MRGQKGFAFMALSIHHIVLDGPSQQIIYSHLTQILAAGRAGQALKLRASDTSKMARDAIRGHIRFIHRRITAPTSQNKDDLSVRLPLLSIPSASAADKDKVQLTHHIPQHAVARMSKAAVERGLTMNAFVLGTLAWLLHQYSGQDRFALLQTYLGREPDMLHAVGSFSTFAPVSFDLKTHSTLDAVCHFVLRETQEALANGPNTLQLDRLTVNVGYELNDVRPVPRRPEGQVSSSFKVCVSNASEGILSAISVPTE